MNKKSEKRKGRIGIRKGDQVELLAGKDAGKRGKVLKALPDEQRAVVERLNMVQRHRRPSQRQQQGGILELEAPIHVSNLKLVCKSCDQGVRFRIKELEDGNKTRICARCGEELG